MGISTKVICTADQNLVILASAGNELWCRQAQNGVNLDFKLNLTSQVKVVRSINFLASIT